MTKISPAVTVSHRDRKTNGPTLPWWPRCPVIQTPPPVRSILMPQADDGPHRAEVVPEIGIGRLTWPQACRPGTQALSSEEALKATCPGVSESDEGDFLYNVTKN